jgi:TRAP-type C4-dicarboxylate transport system permease small subunit
MSLVGGGLCALYLPVLRIVAFAFLFFAGLVILGGLNPFAAMDMSAAARERPGLELKQITFVLSLSALLVLVAFLIEHTRRLRLAQRAQVRKAERHSAAARARDR